MRHVLVIAALVGLLVLAPLVASSPYFLITPGGTYDIASRLQIPAEHVQPIGHLAFTAVYEQEATWIDVIRAEVAGGAEKVPSYDVRPPGTTQEQVNETNRRLIDESKPVAAVVALRAAGFSVDITGQGAQVESIVDGLPAHGFLRVGDIIVGIDGQPIETTNSLIQAIGRHRPGDTVDVTIARDGEQQTVRLGTRSSPSDPSRPIIGVTVSTYQFDVRLPFPVDIDSGGVGGPSAGFMFALGILDAVTSGDLTRGYYIAGTGTIAADGTVGAVGGAAEKALAAEQDGADVFLVPRADYASAQRWVHSIKVVPVDRLEDGVRALCALDPLPTAKSPEVPTPCLQASGSP